MELTLYKTSSPVNAVTKAVKDGVRLTATLKGDYSKDYPVFVITRPDENNYLNGYNYAYCKEFNAWYWVDITLSLGGLARISCNIDPLMTNRNEIYGLTCMVTRQEKYYNPYITDTLLPIAQGTVIKADSVGTVGETSSEIYITCIGAYTPEN